MPHDDPNGKHSTAYCKVAAWMDVAWGIVGVAISIVFLVEAILFGDSDSSTMAVYGFAILIIGLVQLVTGPILLAGINDRRYDYLTIWIVKAWVFSFLLFPAGALYYRGFIPKVTQLRDDMKETTPSYARF